MGQKKAMDGIYYQRLIRDGWKFDPANINSKENYNPQYGREINYVVIFERSRQDGMKLRCINKCNHSSEPNDSGVDHEIHDSNNQQLARYPGSEWADWDHNGDLILSKGSKVYRIQDFPIPLEEQTPLRDFADYTFREVPPTKEALRW